MREKPIEISSLQRQAARGQSDGARYDAGAGHRGVEISMDYYAILAKISGEEGARPPDPASLVKK
jgi:hypothetical protein